MHVCLKYLIIFFNFFKATCTVRHSSDACNFNKTLSQLLELFILVLQLHLLKKFMDIALWDKKRVHFNIKVL